MWTNAIKPQSLAIYFSLARVIRLKCLICQTRGDIFLTTVPKRNLCQWLLEIPDNKFISCGFGRTSLYIALTLTFQGNKKHRTNANIVTITRYILHYVKGHNFKSLFLKTSKSENRLNKTQFVIK